jgi:hypothetical protein
MFFFFFFLSQLGTGDSNVHIAQQLLYLEQPQHFFPRSIGDWSLGGQQCPNCPAAVVSWALWATPIVFIS